MRVFLIILGLPGASTERKTAGGECRKAKGQKPAAFAALAASSAEESQQPTANS